MHRTLLALVLLFVASVVHADDMLNPLKEELFGEESIEDIFSEGIVVDLREPTYTDGVISTTEGGVISGPNIRIQAKKLKYIRKVIDGKPLFRVEAEENLMIEFGNHVFIGDSMHFDFKERSGVVYEGRSVVEPWYFGGEKFILNPDGSYMIEEGYVTTSISRDPDWRISASEVNIVKNSLLKAKNVKFQLFKFPVFWVPNYKTDLKKVRHTPIKYRLRWGGSRGPMVGMSYNIYNIDNWKIDVRLDANLRQGLGGGVEAKYTDDDSRRQFFSTNYYANDRSVTDPDQRDRYRFSGYYEDSFRDDTITADMTYDIVSDEDMPGDYRESGIFRRAVERNQIILRKESCDYIWHAYARARFNTFRTVKQELPAFMVSRRPFNLGETGIVTDNHFHLGYINFKYSNELPTQPADYNALRGEWQTSINRQFSLNNVNIMPHGGFVGIFYNNSPMSHEEFVAVGQGGIDFNTSLFKCYGDKNHLVKPYVHYLYQSVSSHPTSEHYVFDIHDGWTNMHHVKFGMFNSLYQKCDCDILHLFDLDVYALLFFNDKKLRKNIPWIFTNLNYDIFNNLRARLESSWDFAREEISSINFRTEYTHNEDFAIAGEIRHRNEYAWRKVDHDNYGLDVFYSDPQLRTSNLSDKRTSLLFHAYWHFDINWTAEVHTRHGWNRVGEPDYNEYQLDFTHIFRGSWKLRWSFQRREDDFRFTFFVSLGEKRPSKRTENPYAMGLGTH